MNNWCRILTCAIRVQGLLAMFVCVRVVNVLVTPRVFIMVAGGVHF